MTTEQTTSISKPASDSTFECGLCGDYHVGTIVTQRDAVQRYKVGGRAFPHDYNWRCPCGDDNRAFEQECQNCRWTAEQRYHPTVSIG